MIFADMTQLDATGPLGVFSNIPGATITLIEKRKRAVETNGMLRFLPNMIRGRLFVPAPPLRRVNALRIASYGSKWPFRLAALKLLRVLLRDFRSCHDRRLRICAGI